MNLLKLSASYLRAKALNTGLQVVLFALGIGTITLLLLATTQLDQRMRRDAQGIDGLRKLALWTVRPKAPASALRVA